MSLSDVGELARITKVLAELAEDITAQRQPEKLTVEHVQEVVTAALQLYVRTCMETGVFSPVTSNGLTATEASLICSELLEAVDLEVFELTLWKSWGRGG